MLLKAQGYRRKWKDCWVPKSSYMHHPSLNHPNKTTTSSHSPKKQPVYKWVPKNLVLKPSPTHTPTKVTVEQPLLQWRPKRTNPLVQLASLTPTKTPKQTPTRVWRTKLVPITHPFKPSKLTILQRIQEPNQATQARLTARPSPIQSTIQWRSQML